MTIRIGGLPDVVMRLGPRPQALDEVLEDRRRLLASLLRIIGLRHVHRRLVERTGTLLSNGLYAPPTPAAVAALEPSELLPLQFSRQKADYVIATARLVASGQLNLEGLRAMSATRIRSSRTSPPDVVAIGMPSVMRVVV